ncbi:MAG: F0F1 ATP synthase subunit gamma [Acidimicrobiales bacterium]|jgi:F-type H+-transporting ATPase subunit gamma|nr:F0F1 ATP synthase subunit gamma [Acidimicrobiales bacterium]
MPGGKERELKRRISSVQSTKKITRAMELIAATRVVKAMQRADASRPYARQITSVIENLAAGGASVDHPLLREADEVKKVGFIVMAGDRGLAGAYNSNPIRAAERQLMSYQTEGVDYSLFCVGKKPTAYFKFRNYRVDHAYEGFTADPTYEHARRIADDVADAFISGEVDAVELIYTEFVSMGTQRVSVRSFLPLESTAVMAEAGGGSAEVADSFEFEPSPEAVLESLLPRYIEARLFGALLDGAASEHANRQRAMKSATDNAEDLITSLSREMNAARQASITTEIMEIVSGAEALGSGGNKEDIAALISEVVVATSTAVLDPGPFGEGSHAPLPDGSAPAGFTIKGNQDSMLYHRPDSRSYAVTGAEVWFDTPERAEAAGFTLANTHPNADS